jgi:putative FmdB family regulatory protein
MPSYDFECTCCGNNFEAKRGYNDITDVHCPVCRSSARRRFAPVPVIYKGKGFYTTDSRKSSPAPES